jgi:dihydroneopterin aldolase
MTDTTTLNYEEALKIVKEHEARVRAEEFSIVETARNSLADACNVIKEQISKLGSTDTKATLTSVHMNVESYLRSLESVTSSLRK